MPRRPEISPLSLLMRRVDAVADGAPAADTIPSGFPSLDKILGGGLRRGDLVVLGGDVGSGKSALALAIAIRSALAGRSVAFLSGEMSIERIMERALAIEGRARIDDIRRGGMDELTRASVGVAAVRLRDDPVILLRLPSEGVEATRDVLRREKIRDLVVIDSLAGLTEATRGADEELASVVRKLKALAVDLDIAMVLTAGLPGFTPERRDKRPSLDDFGLFGAVKQHADVVLSVYREEMYETGRGIEGATELLVNKNRNGPTGYVDLYFYKQWMRFEDMLDPDR